jgi:HAD superfamily hydrolase (TIGR01450 family)
MGADQHVPALQACEVPLTERYDLVMLDLDGVVYIGPDVVPGAAEQIERVEQAGLHVAFVTNNASRPPATVAEHLRELGVRADAGDVVTSAQAAATLLAEDLPAGSAVFVIGGEGLEVALTEVGLRPVQSADDGPVAVVSGYNPDLRWRTVTAGAILVRQGLPWVASNTDLTVPTPDGPGPGNGVLVRAVADFAQVTPRVAGKPEPPLVEETVRRVGGSRPLMVGDRLDTDIEGAVRAGCDSLLVMTGVTGLEELVRAEPQRRPTYLSAGLAGLHHPHPAPERTDGGWTCGPWTARVQDGELTVADGADAKAGDGEADDRADDWWRVVAAAGWAHLDEAGSPAGVSRLTVP